MPQAASSLAHTIVPAPLFCAAGDGFFILKPGTPLSFSGELVLPAARLLSGYLGLGEPRPARRPAAGTAAEVGERAPGIHLELDERVEPVAAAGSTAAGSTATGSAAATGESYELEVSSAGVVLRAAAPGGLLRGLQTLRQLLPPGCCAPGLRVPASGGSVEGVPVAAEQAEMAAAAGVPGPAAGSLRAAASGSAGASDGGRLPAGGVALPACLIRDRPRFAWRGLMLDVSRHFFPIPVLYRLIEALALHRMNVLHLHLTDDQGWRVEIKRYPRLIEVGAVRPCTVIGHEKDRPRRYDDRPHGGFYSQDELRALVAYAAGRGVEIVPEIEIPGHSQAVVSAYPELGNTGCVPGVRTHWGISRHILNARPATLEFFRNVLEEVIAVFPSSFIHLGGDEAVKTEWEESREIQERMAELGLSTEDALQGWIMRSMEAWLAGRGRRAIGWDEILEGGLGSATAVMSWRGDEGGLRAAREGHDVVMADRRYTYFDYYQAEPAGEPLAIGGLLPLEKVYAFDPVPARLEPEHRHRILGGQGQLWSEYLDSAGRMEYMAFPRASALAEALWLPPENKDYGDFSRRLAAHLGRLDAMGIGYRPLHRF